jgi:GNAT superfamily N-acetyltransferase
MSNAMLAAYVEAFLSRCRQTSPADGRVIDDDGLCGKPPAADDRTVRLLVLDDRAYHVLHDLLPRASEGIVSVFPSANRSAELLARELPWKRDSVTPMVCRDLGDVPDLSLVPELTLLPVRRVDTDPADGVPLRDAVTVALRAQRDTDEPYTGLVEHLRAMPAAIKLFAATDQDGVPRGTSGCGVFGAESTVLFVNTDPGWQKRGIGSAMTSAALCAARRSGAQRACLDASEAGVAMYPRLGFEPLAPITRFIRVR